MADKKHILLKRSLWILGGLVFLLLIAALLAKFWIIPHIATKKIASALEEIWDGPSAVESVEFNYFKPSIVRQISLDDNQNRRWVEIDSVKAGIYNLLRFSPKLSEIEINKLVINAYVTDSNIVVPLKPQPTEQPPVDKFDIRKFVINEAVINIEKDQQSKITYAFSIYVEQQEDFYDVKLTQLTSEPDQMFLLTGRINPETLQADLSIDANQQFKSPQTDVILALLKVPDIYKAEGRLTAKLDLFGALNKPETLQPLGTVNLSGWQVQFADQVVVSDLSTLINCRQNHIDIENLQTNLCNGTADGTFDVEGMMIAPAKISGRVSGERIDIAQLSAAMGREKKISKGTLVFGSNFAIAANDVNSLQGNGIVILNDTGMGAFPVTAKIFDFMGLVGGESKPSADAVAVFAMAGPVITINKARVASPVGAVRAEPGGTINIQTGQLDFYVVAAPLKQVEEVIKTLPIAEYIVHLKDKLARLHIKGHWSESPAELITKEPLTDIKDATVGFLKNVTATEGQIPRETFDEFERLFETKFKQE